MSKKMLVTWSEDDRTRHAYALMLVQLISTAANGITLVLHSV